MGKSEIEAGNALPSNIAEFISEHHLMTLCVSAGVHPVFENLFPPVWCSHAFYAFDPQEVCMIITSEDKTLHASMMLSQGVSAVVAGAIGLETETVGLIRGIQFLAHAGKCTEGVWSKARMRYLKRFPYAVLKKGDLWVLRLDEVKFTDNRLGFGKKLLWKR